MKNQNTKNQPGVHEILESLDFEIQCNSGACADQDPHRADWIVLFSCGHSRNWCNARFIRYRRMLQLLGPAGSLWCNTCTTSRLDPVWVTMSGWWPIRLGS